MNRISSLLLCLLLFACSCGPEKRTNVVDNKTPDKAPAQKQTELGTTNRPIRFYFTPSIDQEVIREKGQPLLDFLEKETGMKFQMIVPDDYNHLIEAFGKEEADVAIMNSLSYIKANKMHGASAGLMCVRYRSKFYFGQIIANSKSGIESVSDINGKSMVFTDSSSGSGYLMPNKILSDEKVKPASIDFVGNHEEVVRKVYRGEADAGATFYSEPASDGTIRDARAQLLDQYPDVADKVKVIQVTEPIPNDPVVFSRDLPEKLKSNLIAALIQFMKTPEWENSLGSLYSIQGYVRCSDSNYKSLREALEKQE